ncbi:MAG TPA: LapA family protein [Gaiellaceae bacterium]|nr:LapA family protein [Gaiellaceae bacterium]
MDEDREREEEFHRSWQPKLWLSLAGLILITAYLIAFAVGNDDDASVNFIFFEATTSLIWVILLSLLAGLVAGTLISQLYARRLYRSDASTETPSSMEAGDS